MNTFFRKVMIAQPFIHNLQYPIKNEIIKIVINGKNTFDFHVLCLLEIFPISWFFEGVFPQKIKYL